MEIRRDSRRVPNLFPSALQPWSRSTRFISSDLIKITRVESLEGHWLRLWFSDGAVKDVDLTGLFARGGVFAPIRDDRARFEQVRVNPETRTIEWPAEVDLDPEVLYGRHDPASGARSTPR